MRKLFSTPKKNSYAKNLAIALVVVLFNLVMSFDASAQGLVFKNSSRIASSGAAGQDGTVYRFPLVAPNVDALVTIKARSSSLVSLVSIDRSDIGHDKAFQPQVTYNNNTTPNGTSDWWMEFEISFVKTTTSTIVPVSSFDITALDIDGNGDQLNEWVSFYGLKSFTYEANTLLGSSNILELINGINSIVGKKYNGPTTNYTDIDTSATRVMITAAFENKNTFRLRTGGHSVGRNGAADRLYSFWFKTFNYQVPVEGSLPVKLSSFTVKKVDTKAVLDWVTDIEKNVSHYVIERSIDGTNFTDAGMIFTNGDGNSDVRNYYSFKDDLKNITKGMVYYRLKMVDLDGKTEKSAIRVLRISEQNETTSILTYPNPVIGDLRVTLPATWQDSKVVIDVVNSFGQVVKHIVNAKAGQTETVSMSDLGAGIYFVRATSGNSTATQRIVKTK